ncbi:extracellular solute-binding protein [uncultured Alsobacter sp.]|uniref:ABC transporter substrate-binding protein n=1 Tax=uncultured Alsobacter sp. TaxID=1748258 RepID=UPI0025F8345F|nr:extracellular solute-binding protein [uncultured Alsobacter sp.]
MTRLLDRRHLLAGAAGLALAAATTLPAAAQTVPTGKVTVELFALATNGFDPVIETFQKQYPNITIKYTKFGTDEFKQALRVGSSSGKMPDLWFNWGGSLAYPYSRAGLTLDLTPRIGELKLDQTLAPAAIELAKDQGKLWGVPNRVVPMTMVYRKEMLEKAGVKVPNTFAELEEAAAKLKAAGIIPFSLGGKFSWMTMRFTDFFIEHYAGPKKHDAIKAMDESWDQEAVVKAFAKLKEWNDKGYFNPGFLNVDPATNMQLLYQGKAAMVLEVPSVEVTRLKRENIDPNTYGTFLMPTDQTPRRVSGFQQQLQVSAKASKDVQDAALLFATYVVRPDLAAKNMESIGGPSAVKGITPGADSPIQSQYAKWLSEGLQLYLPGDQSLPQEMVAAYFEAQDSVVLGAMTPAEAAKSVQQAITAFKARTK